MTDMPIRLGSEIIVNSSVFSYQGEPTVTALAGGGYVVLWTAFVNQDIPDTSYRDVDSVFAQIFDAGGYPVGGEFRVHADRAYSQNGASAVALSDGGFLVVFQSNAPSVGAFDGGEIVMRRFGADGTPSGAEFRINTNIQHPQSLPVITELADGGFVVVWQSRIGGLYEPHDVQAQIFAANGTPVGGEFKVNITTDSNQEVPDVIGLADGSFVVVWESDGQDGSGDGVYARRFAADGGALTAEFRINTATGDHQRLPAIAALRDGGFVVVYDSNNHETTGWGYGIFGQRYDAAGNAVGGEFQINTRTAGDQRYADVVAMPDGGFIVTWADSGVIRLQRFAVDGSPVGAEYQVDADPGYYQGAPAIEVLADGSFVVVWTNYNNSGIPDTIRSQHFAAQSFGTDANNRIAGTPGNDWINGLGGNDSIRGQAGNDTILGGAGNDTLLGLAGSDSILGGDGDDFIDGGGMPDTLDGGAGNDTILGGGGRDWITGGDGDDWIDGGDGRSRMWGDAGNDTILGGTGQDVIRGGTGDDLLQGGAGEDRLFGEAGADTLDGGDGNDRLVGGRDADLLLGGAGSDTLEGGGGRDSLDGGAGDDILIGGAGTDTLTGGAGADIFVFAGGGFGNDRVTDFEVGIDKIQITGGFGQTDIAFDQVGPGARMTLVPTGEMVIFFGLNVADLQGFGDFIFT